MPHVIVKLVAGRTKEQKQRIADAVTAAIMESADKDADSVSVGIEDVRAEDWNAAVYGPDIHEKRATIFKEPGYSAPEETS